MLLRAVLVVCAIPALTAGEASVALAQEAIGPLERGVALIARITHDDRRDLFLFDYRLGNPPSNTGRIVSLDIDVTLRANGASLPGLGSWTSRCRSTANETARRVSIVPVMVDGPAEWLCGLGLGSVQPGDGVVGWGVTDRVARISPGQTVRGFRLTSQGLPAIRKARVKPDVDADARPADAVDRTVALDERLAVRLPTVAPQAPPERLIAADHLRYLLSLVHESRRHGWIVRDDPYQRLLTRLRAAGRRLAGNDPIAANRHLRLFVDDVRALSCADVSCEGDDVSTTEAYALLYFNGKYVTDRLP